jgi:hypothetical protein
MENFTTEVSKMGIYTDPNTHALTFDMNFDFRTSGFPVVPIGDDLLGIGAIDSSNEERAGLAPGSIKNYLLGRKKCWCRN